MLVAQKPFELRGSHLAVRLPGASAVFTTRQGGFSLGPYASLNLGRKTGDSRDAVEANRAALASELGLRLSWVRQVHGARIVTAATGAGGEVPEADGQVTATPGIGAAVLAADCLPIAVASGNAVAILHAGWRGLAAGVIAAGFEALRRLDGEGSLQAAIGPGAGPCCYEVGDDVREVFADRWPDTGRGRNLDLKAIARSQLLDAGAEAVHDAGICTMCSDPALFFSHRRDHGVTGRQAGIAWLN
jgi:YfiH family protein